MVRVAGVEPAWTCAQDMWVAATLHPDMKRGLRSPLLSTLSRRPPGATCEPRLPNRAALPSPRRWTCTPSCFVGDVRVFAAFDASRCLGVVVQGEAALRFRTRHGSSGSMTTAHEAFRIALAAHDV